MKKKQEDLSSFQEWLVAQGLSSRTASVYAVTIRKFLSTKTVPTTHTLDQYIQNIASTKSKAQVDNFYSHWRKFHLYQLEVVKHKIPMPSPRVRTKKVYEVPNFVWEAYNEIKQYNGMKLPFIASLRLKQLRLPPRSKLYEVTDPGKPWILWQIPKSAIDQILIWSNPIRESSIPLFPEEPMSHTKMPLSTLKHLWKEYRHYHL